MVSRYFYILARAYSKHKMKKCNVRTNSIIIGPDYPFDFHISYPERISIGEGSVINGDCNLNGQGEISIGVYCHLAKGLTIISSNHNWLSTESLPYDNKYILKPVVIGDAVWIGANVTILPGVSIGDGSIVAAGSVVIKDVPKGKVFGGNPAKEVGARDMEVMNSLIKSKKFF